MALFLKYPTWPPFHGALRTASGPEKGAPESAKRSGSEAVSISAAPASLSNGDKPAKWICKRYAVSEDPVRHIS
ncbi:MAG TPA: hypothetical protein VMH81_31345 [Bryobacteraceae bacterium]|nr:hypothetical protein [Bryobacteraceae bacterium]